VSESRALLEEQYRTADNLRARISLHERFSTSTLSYPRWVFNGYDFGDEADVLEVGCGDAMIWRENGDRIPDGWRLTLTDLSPGMVEEARAVLGERAQYAVADVQELPFDDASFDAVIANHMLFHVRDRERAHSELARVLRPGGRFTATTVGRDHLKELRELVPVHGGLWSKTRVRFTTETGAKELAPFFVDVEVEPYRDALEVTEAEPLLAFICSRGDVDEGALAAARSEIEQAIARSGSFHVTKATARLRCRKP
jgi:ubiquinone/menaquinone biosynthesis C-methylase UbiE